MLAVFCRLLIQSYSPCQSSSQTNAEIRNVIRGLYTALHDQGVIHGDVEWRHILAPPCKRVYNSVLKVHLRHRALVDKIRIVDFGLACIRSHQSASEWEVMCANEMERVEELFW